MKLSISQIENALQGKTGGRKLTNIPNIYAVYREVLNKIMFNASLPSAIRKVPLLAPFQEQPYLRLLPADISYDGFIDAFKRAYDETPPMIRTGAFESEFMRRFSQGFINIENINWQQYLNLKDTDYNTVYTLDNCEDSTNGTWQAIGTAENIGYDTNDKIVGTASLKFSTPTTTADFGVFKDDFADVASLTDRTYITMYAFFPTYIPSVTIKYGTDNTNYFSVTSSSDWLGRRFTTGWNTIVFDLSTAVETGTVSSWDITYFAYIISTDITTTPTASFKIDGIYLTDDYSYDLTYYSNSVVVDQWWTPRPNNLVSSASDYIMLNENELNLFLMQFSTVTAIDNRPDSGITEYNVYSKELKDSYDRFNSMFPSRKILMSSVY